MSTDQASLNLLLMIGLQSSLILPGLEVIELIKKSSCYPRTTSRYAIYRIAVQPEYTKLQLNGQLHNGG
ncbi:hypothetical protein H6F96_02535 [Microcoleus sp. FACHB-53]|nr:hypothetical protein [Microcoleus sp. FACHB-53]MBD2128393.1 hypothetical protein [Microcoleus sp. FACHB-1]